MGFSLNINRFHWAVGFMYTHFFISTWTFWQKPSLSTYCAYFFRQKPSCAMCLIFLKKKAFMCLFTQVNYIELFGQSLCFGQIVLVMCLFFSTKAFMCYVLNFFEKKAFMWPCAYKKMSVPCFKQHLFDKKVPLNPPFWKKIALWPIGSLSKYSQLYF